jgi:PAP2 superfamily
MNKKLLLIFCLLLDTTVLSYAQSLDSVYQEQTVLIDSSATIEHEQSDTFIPYSSAAIDQTTDTLAPVSIEQNPLKPTSFFPPVALMIYGLTIKGNSGLYSSQHIRQDMQSMFPDFHTSFDDYTVFAPTVVAYATGFIPGTKPRHSNGRRLWLFVQAQVLTSVALLALKHYTHELRPNGSDYLSFPSGHTTQAFMGAALFDVEYPNQLKGVKIGLYALAGLTGMLRMMNDDHWANDVLFGAGMGMLSVRLLYWSEQHWKKKKNPSR